MDGWNTIVSFLGPAYFQGLLLLVSWSVPKMAIFKRSPFFPNHHFGYPSMVYLPIIYHKNQPNVGKYIPYMDGMGIIVLLFITSSCILSVIHSFGLKIP